MKMLGRLILLCVFGVGLASCDLQPKIASLPDTVGDFISTRYPALLADPETQPEIYNSAVADYGVYASPELYGTEETDDYATVGDYGWTDTEPDENKNVEIQNVVKESPKPKEADPVEEPVEDDVLSIPDYVQPVKQQVAESVSDVVQVPDKKSKDMVKVVKGDTLYSIARAHNTTVKEVAEINNLSEPYLLHVGQVVKLPTDKVTMIKDVSVEKKSVPEKKPEPVEKKVAEKTAVPEKKVVVQDKPTETKTVKADTVKARSALKTIKVGAGDTLYSLSRQYELPVNDLAVMNNLSAPFTLKVGQSLKVPNVPAKKVAAVKTEKVAVATKSEKTESKQTVKKTNTQKIAEKKQEKTVSKPAVKSDNKKVANKKQTEKTAAKTTAKSEKTNVQAKSVEKIAARSASKFSWPLRGTILSHYGAKMGGLYNDGINISGALNATVKSAENGIVAYAGNEVRGMGNLVIIQHADGWMTVYAHLNSMAVKRGARVSVGQKIGTVGKTGKVTSPQLHFEIRKGTKAYNPINYLKK